MELKNLRTFLAVVDQGSYQRAAESLGYSQSTITVQIRHLEEELGVPLFERVGRRMVLTEAGEQALPLTRAPLLDAERLMGRVREDQALSGVLRVDMAETLLCYRMQPVIRAFRRRAPQVRLVIHASNCIVMAENVRTGAFDLCLGYDMDWDREALEVRTLGEHPGLVLASPDLGPLDLTTPGSRLPVSRITGGAGSAFHRRLDAYFRERSIQTDPALELWSIEGIKQCVMSGLGITYLPRFTVERELAEGRLKELETPLSGQPIQVLCAWRKSRWITPAMKLFGDLLQTEA